MKDQSATHAALSEKFNVDEDRVNWHDETLWWVRAKRDKAAWQIPEWEQLRETASQIKDNVLGNLHDYLLQFEKNARLNGITVHWAADAEEHNKIVLGILQKNKADRMIKSKSMLTEECHMNKYLSENGIEVIDTDLGERIVQLAEESPSISYFPVFIRRKKRSVNCFTGSWILLKAMPIRNSSRMQPVCICGKNS